MSGQDFARDSVRTKLYRGKVVLANIWPFRSAGLDANTAGAAWRTAACLRSTPSRRKPRRTLALAMLILGAIPTGVLAQAAGILHATYHFSLLQGQRSEVCEAFLKRLEVTKFTNPPYCDIPENDAVPGFTLLHRVPLSEPEIVGLFNKVFSFTYHLDQNFMANEATAEEIRTWVARGELKAWKYSPEISIENNGRPDNVVVWQGDGLYYITGWDTRCGEIFRVMDPPDGARTPQIALILSKDGRSIDERQTRRLLGNPNKNPQLFPGFRNLSELEFVPLGYEMGFFEFHGVYYIYSFDGAALNQHRPPELVSGSQAPHVAGKLLNTLSVYVRNDERLRQVCTYRMKIVPIKNR